MDNLNNQCCKYSRFSKIMHVLIVLLLVASLFYLWKNYEITPKEETSAEEVNEVQDAKEVEVKEIEEEKTAAVPETCKSAPQQTDIGSLAFPIAEKYKKLNFLGQIFTAGPCGKDRWNQLNGVESKGYSLGSTVWLKDSPSQELINTFKDIGYQCTEAQESTCKEWRLTKLTHIEDILLLEPYSSNFEGDDCINCG